MISSDGHITVVSVAGTNLEFNSALKFSSLRSSDSGTYTCFSVVSLVSSYIVSSDSVSASITVTASKLAPRREDAPQHVPGRWYCVTYSLYLSDVSRSQNNHPC